jgi:hypothetical protein
MEPISLSSLRRTGRGWPRATDSGTRADGQQERTRCVDSRIGCAVRKSGSLRSAVTPPDRVPSPRSSAGAPLRRAQLEAADTVVDEMAQGLRGCSPASGGSTPLGTDRHSRAPAPHLGGWVPAGRAIAARGDTACRARGRQRRRTADGRCAPRSTRVGQGLSPRDAARSPAHGTRPRRGSRWPGRRRPAPAGTPARRARRAGARAGSPADAASFGWPWPRRRARA